MLRQATVDSHITKRFLTHAEYDFSVKTIRPEVHGEFRDEYT